MKIWDCNYTRRMKKEGKYDVYKELKPQNLEIWGKCFKYSLVLRGGNCVLFRNIFGSG